MNNLKQIFFRFITNPLAKGIDFFNIPKRIELSKKRKFLAWRNKKDYIETVTRVLIDEQLQRQLNSGGIINPILIPILVAIEMDKARQMFEEKKKNGDFDELNIMLK